MIRIGLSAPEKQREIANYMAQHQLVNVKVFYPDDFPLDVVGAEHIRYQDIIMYKFFYRLLEEIGDNTLLVFNECMRTQNRSDLTYNCAHHYCNQTPHKLVFEHFPFIEQPGDFMILLDLLNKGKYKGKSFSPEYLQAEDIRVKLHHYTLQTLDMPITNKDLARYNAKREQLFVDLGNSDPDTIPRQLHVFVGNAKRQMVDSLHSYVARNDRFKLPNVTTYKHVEPRDYILIDFPHRRIDFNDFLKTTGQTYIRFISSGLKVDLYYMSELQSWIERLGEFYAEASIYG